MANTGLNLTPAIMTEYGFKYELCRYSGADMWQGLHIWYNDALPLTLRGRLSTANGGELKIEGYFNTTIKTVEDLEKLLSLFTTYKKL